MGIIRIDKYISDCGVASRRETAGLIKRGRVSVDGSVAVSGAVKVDTDTAVVTVDGKTVTYKQFHYIMMNKPSGYVSSTSDHDGAPVTELLSSTYAKMGLFPAGRLDKDAEGLLLLTNDGEFAHRVMSPSHKILKRYYVEIDGIIDKSDINAFAEGITLRDGTKCMPAVLETTPNNENAAIVTVGEGKYHQVKRMVAACGKRVCALRRISIGGLALDASLGVGEYRELSAQELESVLKG